MDMSLWLEVLPRGPLGQARHLHPHRLRPVAIRRARGRASDDESATLGKEEVRVVMLVMAMGAVGMGVVQP